MAELRALEQIDAGGVDSRSNPINMPRNRALRCLNWVPKQAGFWELRYGYSTVTMSTITASAIHGMFPFRTWDGHKNVLFMQGTLLKNLDTATGIVTTPTIKGAAVASSAKGAGYFANNRFHYGNGTDQKWFDTANWRDNGLPALTAQQVAGCVIVEGVRELTAAEASTVTLTSPAGGSFPADSNSGHLIYVALFDTSNSEIGPATIIAGTGRIQVALNDKITVANMPNLAGVNVNWVKLIGGTIDGGNLAYFFINTSTAMTTITVTGVNLTQLNVKAVAHGLSTGDVVILKGTTTVDGVYIVTVVDVDNFTATLPVQHLSGSLTLGNVSRIVKAANATTTVDVLAPTQDTSYQVNQNRGLPASSVGGANPGFQFYLSLYNPSGGGHVGNRVAVGSRALQTGYRSNWKLLGPPLLTDPEHRILIGRTGDGAQVPYVCTDPAGNWLFTVNPATTFPIFEKPLISDGDIDANHEMPSRNGLIPDECNMFCVAGDYVYAGDTGSPTLRRSGSLADDRAGIFTGRPEQSWAPNDIDTFPTGEAMTGMFEVDQEVVCGTQHDTAISVNLAGIQQWIGPWAVGIAGRRAGIKCGSHGFFFLSGDKQLCTFSEGVPLPVSEEYEQAELSQIGDAYLPTVELSYFRSASLQKDELRIETQKTDGTPYTIIHDFKLKEYASPPGSIYGQGYSSQFLGPLATGFTVAQIRDSAGTMQVYAGAVNGRIYQCYAGDDDVGNQFTADGICLLNGGTDRPNVPFLDFYGDKNIELSVGRTHKTTLNEGDEFTFVPSSKDGDVPEAVPGAENDFLYRAFLVPPEVQRLYLRFKLDSHSGDGTLALNSPPHIPLENYGRLYEFIPAMGDERER